MLKPIRSILTALILLSAGCSYQKESLAPGEMDLLFFDRYNGLEEGLVGAVASDSSGSIWAAGHGETADRLYRFHHGRLALYSDENEFPLERVERMAVTLDGYCWAAGRKEGEGNRLAFFDYQTWSEEAGVLTGTEGIGGLYGDSRNRLWVSQRDGIISLRTDGQWRHWIEVAAGDSVRSLSETGALGEGRDGSMWCSTVDGLAHLHDDNWHLIPYPGLERTLVAPPLALDWNDGVWCWLKGPGFDGPARFKVDTWEKYNPGITRPDLLYPSYDGTVWLPTDVLYRLELRPEGAGLLGTGLPFITTVVSLAEDWNGHLWLGTTSKGLIRVHRRYIDLHTRLETLLSPLTTE
jgi:ligand-binding sensor domain-containing protein